MTLLRRIRAQISSAVSPALQKRPKSPLPQSVRRDHAVKCARAQAVIRGVIAVQCGGRSESPEGRIGARLLVLQARQHSNAHPRRHRNDS